MCLFGDCVRVGCVCHGTPVDKGPLSRGRFLLPQWDLGIKLRLWGLHDKGISLVNIPCLLWSYHFLKTRLDSFTFPFLFVPHTAIALNNYYSEIQI